MSAPTFIPTYQSTLVALYLVASSHAMCDSDSPTILFCKNIKSMLIWWVSNYLCIYKSFHYLFIIFSLNSTWKCLVTNGFLHENDSRVKFLVVRDFVRFCAIFFKLFFVSFRLKSSLDMTEMSNLNHHNHHQDYYIRSCFQSSSFPSQKGQSNEIVQNCKSYFAQAKPLNIKNQTTKYMLT